MLKLVQVLKIRTVSTPRKPRPVPAQNTFQLFAVAMPQHFMSILQKRVFCVMLNRYWGAKQPHDLTYQELFDLDALLTQYELDEAHNMILDGRQLSLLKQFLTAERLLVVKAQPMVPDLPNADYWDGISELLLAAIRPTQLVKLSFWGA